MNRYIDPAYKPEESLILRYYKAISFEGLTKEDFKAVSLKEGARIFRLLDHRGVTVYLLDESTLMSSGTFKALEACFTIALCKKRHETRIVFSSGANLGSALTLYGRNAGIETFFFHPKSTSWKLDSSVFDHPSAHLIAVDKPEKEVKKAALLFSELSGIKHVPEMEWRFFATGLRALFVFEFMMKERVTFNWMSQAICAGYGPIGFYNMTQRLIQEGAVAKERTPKFLGIQQEALSPMVKAWQKKHSQIRSDDITGVCGELLDDALYNTNPDASYPMLYKHLLNFGGELCSLNKEEYKKYLPVLMKALNNKKIHLNTCTRDGKEEFIENAGLIELAGVLKAIDAGMIPERESVLAFFTGGAGSHSGREAVPEYEIQKNADLETAIRNYLNSIQSSKS